MAFLAPTLFRSPSFLEILWNKEKGFPDYNALKAYNVEPALTLSSSDLRLLVVDLHDWTILTIKPLVLHDSPKPNAPICIATETILISKITPWDLRSESAHGLQSWTPVTIKWLLGCSRREQSEYPSSYCDEVLNVGHAARCFLVPPSFALGHRNVSVFVEELWLLPFK